MKEQNFACIVLLTFSRTACYTAIENAHPTGMYGNETCGVMDPITMRYVTNMGYSDGAHPSSLGWAAFEVANYAAATAFLATIAV